MSKIDDLVRDLVIGEAREDLGQRIIETVKGRFPPDKLLFEPSNEIVRFKGVERAKIQTHDPLVVVFEFNDDMPMGPDPDRATQISLSTYEDKYGQAMAEWEDFITGEVGKTMKSVDPNMDYDVEIIHTNEVAITVKKAKAGFAQDIQ